MQGKIKRLQYKQLGLLKIKGHEVGGVKVIRVYKYLMSISIRKTEELFSSVKGSVTRSNEIKLTETI